MPRPKCYFESPIGFETSRSAELEVIMGLIRPVAEPINPFFIVGEDVIQGILETTGEERQSRWNAMALRLYRVIRDEADMGFAFLNGDPPDFGVGCEMGYGFALHDTGHKKFPVVAYRQDHRRSGETDNNLNSMALPPYMETGGSFVDTLEAIPDAIGAAALTLI